MFLSLFFLSSDFLIRQRYILLYLCPNALEEIHVLASVTSFIQIVEKSSKWCVFELFFIMLYFGANMDDNVSTKLIMVQNLRRNNGKYIICVPWFDL